MEATSKKDVTSLIESIISDANERNGKLLFIKYSNTFSIKFDDVTEAVNKDKTMVQTLYHQFKPGVMQPAYCPLMDWIGALYKRYFSDIDYIEFLDNCDVYPLHQNIFKNYFEKGVCRRTEIIIRNEAEYEHDLFIKDIIKIFNTISDSIPLLLILDDLQYCEKSLLEFLYYLTLKNTKKRFSVLADFNEKYVVADYMYDLWETFSQSIETQNMMLYWEFDSMIISDYKHIPFVPDRAYFNGYLKMINNMVNTLSLEQALDYCRRICEHLNSGSIFITNKEKYLFYNIYGNALFLHGDYDEAIKTSGIMKEIWETSKELNDVNYEYNFNELACHAYIYSRKDQQAMDYVLECKRIAYGSGNGFLMFQADLLRYTAMMRGWDGTYLLSAFGVMYEIDPDFLSLAEKYNYLNNLAYVVAFGYGNDQTFYRDSIKFCESREHVVKSRKIAEQLKNEYLIQLMCHKHIKFASRYGYFSVADYYYKIQLDVYERAGKMRDVGIIYNGLGYNRIIMGHYNYASEFFNSAINVWYKLEMPEEIGMTLYNMAINAILMEEYSVAIDLISTTLRIMKYLNQINLQYCNMSKLYGMMVYCNYKLNIDYNAQFYLNKMEYILHHLLYSEDAPDYNSWDNEMFLYYISKGLLIKKKNPDEAQRFFDKAKYHMERADDLYFFIYMIFAIEQSAFYKEKNQMDDFKKVLNKCIDHFQNHGCNEKADRLFAILNNKSVATTKINSGLKNVTTFQLIELARRVGSELELNTQNRYIRFLSGWQKLMNNDEITNVGTLFNKSVEFIKHNFATDKVYMFSMHGNEINVDFADEGVTLTDKRVNSLVDFFNKGHQSSFTITRSEKRFYDYSSMLNVFGINQVFSLICVPVYEENKLQHLFITYIESHGNFSKNYLQFRDDALTIFKFAYLQLIDASHRLRSRMEIQEMNVKLEKTAVTDLLTGLLNRQGFSKYLEEEFSRMSANNGNNNVPTTVLYIDLDNFKYYNDTFGHDIGDVLLVSFSKLFKSLVGDKGYSVRYGGDEFLVILPNATEDAGVDLALSIYKKLDETNGFEGEIKAKMGRNFNVDKKNRVSCSIGIATSKTSNMASITETLKNADSALYVVKKSTKRNYRVWQG